MTFEEILDQAIAMLQRRGRVTCRTLKRQFQLDEDALEDLKAEIITGQRLAVDEDGEVLVWTGGANMRAASIASPPPHRQGSHADQPGGADISPAEPRTSDAERRQLTVLFCDLVDSTALAIQLDPEDLREVVRAYQATCAEVIQRFEGYIAQYLGDGLLVYFGYPQAHEDDAQRAVRTGLGMVAALGTLQAQWPQGSGGRLAVRVGIHTGLVVVGEMGGGTRQEPLALGDTPNIAARLQSLAAPNRVVISERIRQLVGAAFDLEALGPQTIKGVPTPMPIYGIRGERTAESRFEAASTAALTPLVGREEELALVLRRWAQARAGEGQVVLVTGEPGIGKSRLLQAVRERVAAEPHLRLSYQCSPYHANSAFYPLIAHLERTAHFAPDDSTARKLDKLEALLAQGTARVAEVAPLVAALWSIPTGDRYPPLALSPERQKAQTIAALVDQVAGLSRRQPVLCLVEDAHWCDPTTLEVLDQLVHRVPELPVLVLITARPEFTAPWTASHLTTLTLTRLGRAHVATMVAQLTSGKVLPSAVLAQILAKTDGVPLFVEELTKTILESGLLCEVGERYLLTGPLPPLAIPATVQDSLMARLDRLAPVKEVAQLGAVLGREFSYDLLAAVSPVGEPALPDAIEQLVRAGLLFRRGQPPEAYYRFKHALVQDAAYASLLKSRRQALHLRIATVLEARFPAIAETEPEVLARHYTEAGLPERAMPYWQQAGQQALERSANVEAVQHLTMGLALLALLPDTPARAQQELDLLIALGPALSAIKGLAAPEVEQAYARARALCQQVGDTPQRFPTLRGLCEFYRNRGAMPTARELGEQLYRLAQREADPTPRLEVHDALGSTLFFLGDYPAARRHLEQGVALIGPAAQRALTFRYGVAPRVRCLALMAHTLWCLGFPAQAVRRSQEALALAQTLAHPQSLAVAQHWAAYLHYRRREAPAVQAQAEALLTLAAAQGFPLWVGLGTCWLAWALAEQGQREEGLVQLQQGMAAALATGQEVSRPLCLVLMAEAAGHAGQVAEGLRRLAEALTAIEESGRGELLAEAYRLQGELLLRQVGPAAAQAETCFQQALAVARRQEAKSLELRAATSLARLWQQGKRDDARELLASIYGWFTEGFNTADLQEAKALLTEVSR